MLPIEAIEGLVVLRVRFPKQHPLLIGARCELCPAMAKDALRLIVAVPSTSSREGARLTPVQSKQPAFLQTYRSGVGGMISVVETFLAE